MQEKIHIPPSMETVERKRPGNMRGFKDFPKRSKFLISGKNRPSRPGP